MTAPIRGGSGGHPLLGRRLPSHELTTPPGTVLLRPLRGLLIDLAGDDALRRTAAPWAGRVDVVTAGVRNPGGPFAGTTALLVRPDGHVAWTAPGGTDLIDALHRWFGPR